MKAFLEGLLPRILPAEAAYRLIPHQGKADLEKSIPRKLRAWREPGARFIVVRDQDSADCRDVKARLSKLCTTAGRPDVLIRIACRELEAWYLADLRAVDTVYGTHLQGQQQKRKFREPDRLTTPSRELKSLVPAFSKINGARRLGPVIDCDNERSASFRNFVRGVRDLA